jgi:hypothetical protein
MKQITINVSPAIYEHIMFFLQNLPKNLVDIQTSNKAPNSEETSKKAFGLLKGKVKDPVKWQNQIREESERDVYGSSQK